MPLFRRGPGILFRLRALLLPRLLVVTIDIEIVVASLRETAEHILKALGVDTKTVRGEDSFLHL